MNKGEENIKSPLIFGVGYLGVGIYKAYNNGKINLSNRRWRNMLSRCYNKKYHGHLTYAEIFVTEEWLDYQNFAQWCEENYNSEIMQGWALDKDILVKGNKIYSPETCCFVPKEINSLFTKSINIRGDLPIGVKVMQNKFQARLNKNGKSKCIGTFDTPEEAFQAYKVAKEEYIKEVADRWRGQITEECYQAMYNWVIEITD